jgi:hypothetical protein
MLAAMRSVGFTLLLMVGIIYIFAVAFRQVTDGSYIGDEYFQSVPKAMGTLLNRGAFIDELSALADDILINEPWLLILLYAFVLIASLSLMNMLVGVLVEVVQAVAATEKEALTISYVREQLEGIMTEMDKDGTGSIARKEFLLLLNNEHATSTLASVEVDVVNLVDAADFIFHSDEIDDIGVNIDKKLSFSEFLELILSLRGTNTATVRDIVDLRKFVQAELKKMERRTEVRAQSSANSLSVGDISELGRVSVMSLMGRYNNIPANCSPGGPADATHQGGNASHFANIEADVSRLAKYNESQIMQIGSKSPDNIQLEMPTYAAASASSRNREEFGLRTNQNPIIEEKVEEKLRDRISVVEDSKTEGKLAHLSTLSFRRHAEATFQRLLLELEEHHEKALADLRGELKRIKL